MYIDSIQLDDIRCFERAKDNVLEFVHPDRNFKKKNRKRSRKESWLPEPRLKNVTLLLGQNGSGKTTVLQALAAIGMRKDADIFLRDPLIIRSNEDGSIISVKYSQVDNEKEERSSEPIEEILKLYLIEGDPELKVKFASTDIRDNDSTDNHISNKPVITAGYDISKYPGTYPKELLHDRTLSSNIYNRLVYGTYVESSKYKQFWSLFISPIFLDFDFFGAEEDDWLFSLQKSNQQRFDDIIFLLKNLLKPFNLKLDRLNRSEINAAFKIMHSLRSGESGANGQLSQIIFFLDLLSQINRQCPEEIKIKDYKGVVLVDQIECNLHPSLHMKIIKTIAKTFPKIQFIITTQSPLVAGSVEWMNIINLEVQPRAKRTIVNKIKKSIYGLDAEQILLSPFFGMKSTVAKEKEDLLLEITERIRNGDRDAPLDLLRELSSGMEEEG